LVHSHTYVLISSVWFVAQLLTTFSSVIWLLHA
jgi:hypothetical protein